MAYNKIILEGNLVRNIEIKYTQGGSAIANTSIAVSRKFKKQDGTQGEEVLFVDLTFFSRSAEIANQYLRKGSKILVDGRLKLDQWTAQDGSKRSKHSVIVENLQMLGNKEDSQSQANPQNNMDDPNKHNVAGGMNKPANHQSHISTQPQGAALPDMPTEDEIPF